MPSFLLYRADAGGNVSEDKTRAPADDRRAIRLGFTAWWLDPDMPRRTKVFATPQALAAGFKAHPAGYGGTRFVTPEFLQEGDEFIPLIAGKSKSGKEIAAAAVIKFNSDFKGALVVSGLQAGFGPIAHSERQQALYLVRSILVSLAVGVEKFFAYELRATESDPYYSESHFGIVHRDLSPKPAYSAYAALIAARPAGSVQTPGPWRDETRGLYFPQWTRPDGTPAGVIWKTGATERMALRFADAARPESAPPKETALPGESAASTPVFRSFTGRLLRPARGADGTWSVPVGEEPLFFEGARLVTERL